MTDSNKWKDPWFSDLPSKYKLFWMYILDECDHAGIWKVNFKLAQFMIGDNLEQSEVKRILGDRMICVSDNYWFIMKFLKYQYPNGLKPTVKAQESVINILKSHDLIERVSDGLGNGYITVQDIDKDIDISNRKEKFKKSLTPFVKKYDTKMLKDFYEYWTEHGKDDKKMRFEKEKTFGLSRRLSTWNKNNDKFNPNSNNNKREKYDNYKPPMY